MSIFMNMPSSSTCYIVLCTWVGVVACSTCDKEAEIKGSGWETINLEAGDSEMLSSLGLTDSILQKALNDYNEREKSTLKLTKENLSSQPKIFDVFIKKVKGAL